MSDYPLVKTNRGRGGRGRGRGRGGHASQTGQLLKLKFCVIEEVEDRCDHRTESKYAYATVLTSGGRMYGLGIALSEIGRIEKDKCYKIKTPTPINGIFHLEKYTEMEEIEKFPIEPERIEEVLYPACRKVSDLTKDRLMTIAIRERLSVQGYVKMVSGVYDTDRDPKRTLTLTETKGADKPVISIRLWREKSKLQPKVGQLIQVLSLKRSVYNGEREIHSTPSTIIRKVSGE
uniref:Uncharacterized protein LOC111123720 n=1 Tax=Crassostrea virginica TaxID=6565 RepID=A0A8B8D1E2_CRAVI|nr:uncharacterized protein LOC111123720 [Crassostrea virginica]